MTGLQGDVSPDEVRARWAYSELLSGRYDGRGVEDLMAKSRQRVPFAKLGTEDRDLLARAWAQVRGTEFFNAAIESIEAFQLKHWSARELSRVVVIPDLLADVVSRSLTVLPIPFELWINADPIKPLHQGHARYAMYDPVPHVGEIEPLTVGLTPSQQAGQGERRLMLLDGYHRAVRFWYRRSVEPTATLPVFIPQR